VAVSQGIQPTVRFGIFESPCSNRRTDEAWQAPLSARATLPVAGHALQTPGQLVTREEVSSRRWPRTIVDFDHGLNKARSLERFVGEFPLHRDGRSPWLPVSRRCAVVPERQAGPRLTILRPAETPDLPASLTPANLLGLTTTASSFRLPMGKDLALAPATDHPAWGDQQPCRDSLTERFGHTWSGRSYGLYSRRPNGSVKGHQRPTL
jgi:hypothetical protein